MIHEMGRELQTILTRRGCPFPVIDGPERTDAASWSRERIVIEYDMNATDTFASPHSQRANPKHSYLANESAKITIYAQSGVNGPMEFEHRRRARHARDMVLVALRELTMARHIGLEVKSGRAIVPTDREGEEIAGGSGYEILFTFERAIQVLDWAGNAQPQTTLGPGGVVIKSTTKATQTGGVVDGTIPVGAVTSCGT